MHIVIITAGGAGMFCGSCMHDNTWARALMAAGAEVSLIPTYTPIRVDEEDVSDRHVFMGGINLYLEHKSRLWRHLPRAMTRWLDHPAVIRFATARSISSDAAKLGDLTLDMLAGESGPLARDVDELADHIATHLKPDVVIFSNALISGALRRLKERFAGPVFCTLQGDDVFTDGLADTHRDRVVAAMSERAQQFDGFFTHSEFYRDHMAAYLNLPADKFRTLPLGIDLSGHGRAEHLVGRTSKSVPSEGEPRTDLEVRPTTTGTRPFTIGYFARVAPEKGLHHLVDAALELHQRRPGEFVIKAGGFLTAQHRKYFADVQRAAAPLGKAFEYIGSPNTLTEKVKFYQTLDVLSVPTEFLEPKGLYILEALANGIPVVQPAHGAFPELIEATEGGLLVQPRHPRALSAALERLMDEPALRTSLGETGQIRVHERFNPQRMADETLRHLEASLTSATPQSDDL